MRTIRRLWWQFRETRDAAWQDGYNTCEADYEEVIESKDAFIAKQSEIIEHCMKVFDINAMWGRVPKPLQEKLADYA